MRMDKQKLLKLLDSVRAAVENDDSIEGMISYSALEVGLERGEFKVEGGFRIGNRDGQGGSIVIPEGIGP